MISVIICTYNRDRVFEETVRSFLDSRKDGIEHELLLVDNNSTDNTRDIGKRLAAASPGIRYLNEPLQGHPHAKNRGIRESTGDIVAFADDDVLFAKAWLPALASVFARNPDVSCVGGRVVPHFEEERPNWIEDDLLWIYGVTRYGDREREIRYPEIPIGCNMAFRRAVFDRIGDFHTSLGRKPGILLSGDEDHFLIRASKAGLKTLYSPDAEVAHRIPTARANRKWVLSRFYWAGVSEVAMRQLGDDPLPRFILAKQSVRMLFRLIRRWREVAGLLVPARARDGNAPIGSQVDVCHRMGTLRQMIAETFAPAGRDDTAA